MRGGPLSEYCQPVEIRAPKGARISPAANHAFADGQKDRLLVGLSIGPVYRFRVTEIPEHPGIEVFPTVEVIDRLYPPPGESLKFPIPVELTENELLLAADGKFITRVIYLEDPQLAIPIDAKPGDETRWVEVRPGEDPLVTADTLGRPMAILRMGGRLPDANGLDATFVYGAAPAMIYNQHAPQAPAQPLPPPRDAETR
jgi:hypothetical protein